MSPNHYNSTRWLVVFGTNGLKLGAQMNACPGFGWDRVNFLPK